MIPYIPRIFLFADVKSSGASASIQPRKSPRKKRELYTYNTEISDTTWIPKEKGRSGYLEKREKGKKKTTWIPCSKPGVQKGRDIPRLESLEKLEGLRSMADCDLHRYTVLAYPTQPLGLSRDAANFRGLALVCIEAKFCK